MAPGRREVSMRPSWYAEWYRDINEEQYKYDGKILNVKARLVNGGEIPKNKFVFGRHVMTCCVEDIQFAGLVCKWSDEAAKFNNGEWVSVTAKVKVEEDPIYGGGPGPVLYCSKVKPASPAIPEVATF